MAHSLIEILQTSIPNLRKQRLRTVKVAVIDSGIDATHEALADGMVGAWGFAKSESGEVTMQALPLVNNDTAGHGTAVASIIRRLAPNTKIVDYRVLNRNGSGTGDIMLKGLEAAIESDAKIINMSLASLKKYQPELEALCERAYQKHKIIIAAKRNVPKVGDLGFPAELSSCISVDNRTMKSPFFVDYIDEQPIEFAALGEAVLVAQQGGGYYRLTGTSFATPTVAGIVALLLGKYPDLDLFEIKSILKHHALLGTYNTAAHLSPMEVADKKLTRCAKGLFAKCACGKELICHEAFSYAECPACGRIHTFVALVDKRLYDEVLRDLRCYLPESYTYHNRRHTQEVVSNVISYLNHYPRMAKWHKKCLVAAALLHDVGFKVTYENNEPHAARYAETILPRYGFSAKEIALVQSLILATAMPVHPTTLLEKILCDADVGHIGTPHYLEKALALRNERAQQGHIQTNKAWVESEIAFLEQQHFFQPFLERERRAERERMKAKIFQLFAVRKRNRKTLLKTEAGHE